MIENIWGVPTRAQDSLCNKKHNLFKKVLIFLFQYKVQNKNKLRGLSPHANYTDRAAAAGRRS